MVQRITVTLADNIIQALDAVSQSDGVSTNEVIDRAVQQHLFLRQFRSLRERMIAKEGNQGLTDQDIFDRIS